MTFRQFFLDWLKFRVAPFAGIMVIVWAMGR